MRQISRVTERYAQSFNEERKERAVEKIFLRETELDFYDFSRGRYSNYALPRLFPSGLLSIELYSGDNLNVEVKTEYVINTANMHKEVHSVIANGEECRAILMRSILKLKCFINLKYGKYINRLVKEEWATVAEMERINGIINFDGYGFQVYPNSISTMGLETFNGVLKQDLEKLNCEQRIALAELIVEKLNRGCYHNNGIRFSYVRDGAFGGRVRLLWSQTQSKVNAKRIASSAPHGEPIYEEA